MSVVGGNGRACLKYLLLKSHRLNIVLHGESVYSLGMNNKVARASRIDQ